MQIPEIIIVATEENEHANAILNCIKEEYDKISALILDISKFPQQLECKLTSNNKHLNLCFIDDSEDQNTSVSFEKVKSIFWLEPKIPKIDPVIKDPHQANFAFVECCQLLEGIWYIMDCLWVNHPERQEVSLNPLYQLQLAKGVGFSIAKTLVTNDPSSVIEFRKKNKDEILYKQLIPIKPKQAKVLEEDLAYVNNVRFAPLIFQEIVDFKQCFKIITIGTLLFVTEYCLDSENNKYFLKKSTIPLDIERKIKMLVQYTGLNYCTVDIGIDKNGKYYFSSLNPYAHFLNIEKESEFPLTKIITELLIKGKPTSSPHRWPNVSKIII